MSTVLQRFPRITIVITYTHRRHITRRHLLHPVIQKKTQPLQVRTVVAVVRTTLPIPKPQQQRRYRAVVSASITASPFKTYRRTPQVSLPLLPPA